MIVTIDGPAGAGKSSIARVLAERLGFQFLDTGAMYRAVTLAALRENLGEHDVEQVAELARRLSISVSGPRIWLGGEEVTSEIRSPAISRQVAIAASNSQVRAIMVDQQRAIGARGDTVTEGRDQGTVVFPEAECKIFLTASPMERARRRYVQLQERGDKTTLDEVLAQQSDRDHRDSTRAVGPLKKPDGAEVVLTDGMTPDEVIARLETMVRTCQQRLVGSHLQQETH